MSVGHLARILESAGISTVVIGIQAFRERLEAMRVPRLLLTPYLLGRTLGVPHDAAGQLRVLRATLKLLDEAQAGGTIVEFQAERYSPVSLSPEL